ncbi:redoxin domain-containing protein [Nonomuraea sp. NPDC023979]|uniref:redoxin domain-containing protein n=1 Tax=Nonomuraea sp. NPDC023979 TaxID=3154796 RepID=UPI003404BE06
MSNVRSAAAAMAALALLAAACGTGMRDEPGDMGNTGDTAMRTSAPAASPAGPGSASSAPAALRFDARTLDGEPFEGESLAGRPVAFWFWAPWCPKCLSDAPAVKAAAARHGDVTVVGVAGLDTEAAMKQFVRRTGTGDLVHLSDAEGALWTKLGVSEQSTFVFMRPDGSTEKVTGPLGQDKLETHLRALATR